MGNYTKVISTLTGAFGMFEQDKSNLIILVFMLSLFKFNQSVSVCMLNNLGYRQDRISLSDPPIPGTPEMGCLRPFVVALEKLYHYVCSHCLQLTLKPHWIHMSYKQSLIQFCCQKEQPGQAQTSQVS